VRRGDWKEFRKNKVDWLVLHFKNALKVFDVYVLQTIYRRFNWKIRELAHLVCLKFLYLLRVQLNLEDSVFENYFDFFLVLAAIHALNKF
jgi:hypothetical protein